MLILTRKPGERILIGEEVEVVVIESSAHQVRLGIEAPREVHVLRSELKTQSKNGAGEKKDGRHG